MYDRMLVPRDFLVPGSLDGPGYRLRMLSFDDAEKDFEAVMASADQLRGLFGPENPWPEGVTLKEDMIDLAWHQREFTLRHSFAYTVMSSDEASCLGCTYIFPSNVPDYDAVVFYWVRSGVDHDARDKELGAQFRQWLASDWPFRAPAFPGRDIPWSEWLSLNRPGKG